MEKLKEFKQGITHEKIISQGTKSIIYQIANMYVAKFYFKKINSLEIKILEDITTITFLQHENEIAQILYQNNISVPKPKGIFNIPLKFSFTKKSKSYPGFVMEYIKGRNIAKLTDLERWPLLKIMEKELKKVRALGIDPVDSDYYGNCLWNPIKKKIYLIDFKEWYFDYTKNKI